MIGARHLLAGDDMCSSDLDRAEVVAARFTEDLRRG
jgi:hypothetical protein